MERTVEVQGVRADVEAHAVMLDGAGPAAGRLRGQDGHGGSLAGRVERGGQSGDAGSGDEDIGTFHAPLTIRDAPL